MESHIRNLTTFLMLSLKVCTPNATSLNHAFPSLTRAGAGCVDVAGPGAACL